MRKIIIGIVIIAVLIVVGKNVYDININYNFKEISKNMVYKSGVIPPDEIESYTKKYKIKSIIDLRLSGAKDTINNPEIPEELLAEKEAVEKIEGGNYYNVESKQVPSQETLDYFFEIMDDPDNYPVLIHCYHGEGRAPLYGAIYRIEYENMPVDEARMQTRFLVKWSSFDDDTPKGEFLKNYKKRDK